MKALDTVLRNELRKSQKHGGRTMLVLTCKNGQSMMIGDTIEVTVLKVRGNIVKIGINGPRNVRVRRKELPCEAAAFSAVGGNVVAIDFPQAVHLS